MENSIIELKNIINNSDNIVFFGGAGVSTESNIPDFRSESGLYNAVSRYGYPPEEMLSRTFFNNHTEVFYKYYIENLLYLEAKPNMAHIALAKLEKEGKLKAVITQNIDGLHQLAGSKNVIELHGSVHRNYCKSCHKFYDASYIKKATKIPKCECGGLIKPDVVLYEESLDYDKIEKAIDYIKQAQTLIVGGTSLAVYPAASFINYFNGKDLILINKSPTPYDKMATLVINDSIGKVLNSINSWELKITN